jgi:hypothetical protein
MARVFQQEAAGLVQTVATGVWLTLDLAGEVQVQRVHGYDYDLKEQTMRVQFDDAGAEGNQILMVKMVVPAGQGPERPLAHATLEYDDAFAETHEVLEADLTVSYGVPTLYDPLVSPAVRRNVTILHMAEALQQVSYLCGQREYQEALSLVQEIKPDVWQIATEEGDEEMQEDVELLSNYETTLQKLVEVASAPPAPAPRQEERPRGGMCFGPIAMSMVALTPGMVRGARRRQAVIGRNGVSRNSPPD